MDAKRFDALYDAAVRRPTARPTVLKVFIGFDPRETVAFHVLAHSILSRCSVPVAIIPLALSLLGRTFQRARDPLQSTDFAYTRFLVPHLSGYEGLAVFMDCDMLCRIDLAELLIYPLAFPDKALFVCPHDYTPTSSTKFLGHPQTIYPRKNWSSLMLFNTEHCAALTPAVVNAESGAFLHRFQWTADERIGHLPLEFNWLVGEYPRNDNAKIWHWTNGGPWFDETCDVDHAAEWQAELARMVSASKLQVA